MKVKDAGCGGDAELGQQTGSGGAQMFNLRQIRKSQLLPLSFHKSETILTLIARCGARWQLRELVCDRLPHVNN